MALKNYNPTTPSQRGLISIEKNTLWKGSPLKMLTESSTSKAGRNNKGQITVRRRGGGHKQAYRVIDFKRNKFDVVATVERIQ